jgi:hypothetical protein
VKIYFKLIITKPSKYSSWTCQNTLLGKLLEEPALSILAIFTVLALAVLPFPILPILAAEWP